MPRHRTMARRAAAIALLLVPTGLVPSATAVAATTCVVPDRDGRTCTEPRDDFVWFPHQRHGTTTASSDISFSDELTILGSGGCYDEWLQQSYEC